MKELFFLESIPSKALFEAPPSCSWTLLLLEPPNKYMLNNTDVFQVFYKRI